MDVVCGTSEESFNATADLSPDFKDNREIPRAPCTVIRWRKTLTTRHDSCCGRDLR